MISYGCGAWIKIDGMSVKLPAVIYCLYHEKQNCSCITPVTDQKTLIERLEHFISLTQLHLRHAQAKFNDLDPFILRQQLDQAANRLVNLRG